VIKQAIPTPARFGDGIEHPLPGFIRADRFGRQSHEKPRQYAQCLLVLVVSSNSLSAWQARRYLTSVYLTVQINYIGRKLGLSIAAWGAQQSNRHIMRTSRRAIFMPGA
jgi:hypothetical protein